MEYHFGQAKDTSDEKSVGNSENAKLSQASQNIKLEDRFKQENSGLSYADLHHQITSNENDLLQKSKGKHPKQIPARKGYQEREFVRYMSKLPSYLERGEKRQEKLLNVGVLDWGRLEKWQCSSKQMSNRSERYSPSSSNTSSSLLADGSSLHSNGGQNLSPTRQTMRRPSLQFHLMASPIEGHVQALKSYGESAAKLQNLKPRTINQTGKPIIPDKPSQSKHPEIKLEQYHRRGVESSKDPENGTLLAEVTALRKGKNKTQDGEFMKRAVKLQEQASTGAVQNEYERDKMVILLLPRDLPRNNQSEASHLSESATMSSQVLEEASRRSLPERSKDLHHAKLDSCVPHSCPLISEFESNKVLKIKSSSLDGESIGVPSPSSRSRSLSGIVGVKPSMHQNLEEKEPTLISTKSTADEPSSGLDLNASKLAAEKLRSSSPFRRLSMSMGESDPNTKKPATEKVRSTSPFRRLSITMRESDLNAKNPAAEKVRSTSPFRRLSISMGKIVKSSRSNEGSAQPLSGPENATASACLDGSTSDKSSSTSRAKSSPLRRLLDPLRNQKPANCRHIPEPLLDYSSIDSHSKPSSKSFDSIARPSGKEKVDMKNPVTVSVNTSSQDEAKGSTAVQALLRVAIRNGQPLFTFAVDKDRDIFAAALSKLCPLKKGDCSWTYTFFSIREVKKKSGIWMSKEAKGKGQDYVPTIVAQMKVFDSQFSNSSEQKFANHLCIREFVLFSVDLKQADQRGSDLQPNDELAAIVVKIPTRVNRYSIANGCQRNNYSDMSENDLPEFQGRQSCSGDMVQSRPGVSAQGLINATVILPSGSHTLPNKGGPSSLIQRWKTGGLCDCGGWDLGCKLNILANPSQSNKKCNSSRFSSTSDKFELFPQEGVQDNQPLFSLSPFKEGIYSVEFSSSVSVMQAFSICIAILDSGKVGDVSESSNEFEDRSHEETISIEKTAAKAPRKTEGKAPARYASYPPLSPVGRV